MRAARLSFCHAAVSISDLDDPERCGLAQRAQRPRIPAERSAPQFEQTRASTGLNSSCDRSECRNARPS
jgi:hypothetical protein